MQQGRAGVDVGGTFTDAVYLEDDGTIRRAKVLTTADDQSVGTVQALGQVVEDPTTLSSFHHGYTVGINAALTRSGAKTGLLLTAGHRDLLDHGRLWRPFDEALYDPTWQRPHEANPVVERRHRREVSERVREDGEVLVELDEAATRREVEFLRDEGVESIGISFMHGHEHPAHEARVREIVKEVMPEAYVQSSDIWPVSGEFTRAFVVALDAYTGPPVVRYLGRLEERLATEGFEVGIEVMQMNGGLRSSTTVRKMPVATLQSGPVAGLLGAQFYSRELLGRRSLVCLDIGGTSSDLGVIRDGDAEVTNDWELEHAIPLAITTLDVRSIGAGGGSLIQVDTVGSLRVGPESAGSKPGPACYGLGGTQPAMSDAYVAMGLLQPNLFLGGEMTLDRDRAHEALASVGDRIGMSVTDLAQGAWDIMNTNIAAAIRGMTINRGLDPRECSLFPYGGAGAMHAVSVARELGIPEVTVPYFPGGFSAFGMIVSRKRVEYSTAAMKPVGRLGVDGINEMIDELSERCRDDLRSQGVPEQEIRLSVAYYGMYSGQSWDSRVPLGKERLEPGDLAALEEGFHDFYDDRFGYRAPEIPIVIASVSVTGFGPPPTVVLPEAVGEGADLAAAVVQTGTLHMDRREYTDVRYYDRGLLPVGAEIEGPAVIDDKLGTIAVNAGARARVGDAGTLHIDCGEE
ncbi:MAG TPA: hydantoinase/oxoprolinase family protein [Solirubrobacterales bacterium]|nr:hydantoinase/oxoprolinase family protein [Solirubrobacterales bacterium]